MVSVPMEKGKTMNNGITNAEYLLSMKKEELARLLLDFCENSERCYFCPFNKIVCGGESSVEEWVEWLDKPLEVDKE